MPTSGRVVGIDLGQRRIGVAVSDSGRVLAVPHSVVERRGDAAAERAELARVVGEIGAVAVVVGYPLSLDGSRGPAAVAAEAEAEALAEALGLPVELADERLSTAGAHRSLTSAGLGGRARRKVVDQVAASVILQGWLDDRAVDRP